MFKKEMSMNEFEGLRTEGHSGGSIQVHHQHGRALDFSCSQLAQGLVGFRKRKGLNLGSHRQFGSKFEKLLSISTGQIGDRTKASLFPQQVVGKRRNVAHVDAGANDCSPALKRSQGWGNETADGSQNDGCVEAFGW